MMTMNSDTEILHDFLVERSDLFDRIESLALAVDAEPASDAGLTSLVQAVHALTNQFGVLGFRQFEVLGQELERSLEAARSAGGAVPPNCVTSALSLVGRARAFFETV
ncbi:MAG: hypothetical protein R2761_17705 [Acidimicrobiales bacterium]